MLTWYLAAVVVLTLPCILAALQLGDAAATRRN
jgi:hypothetical protein